MDQIVVRGAREHNLKDITVELPRDRFIVITGLSGSGKSTLAFDTIYAEGQRRYVESLSAYARQFLGLMNKPDVDSIDGLSPAISIEQKTTSKNPRSTVGTVTEIYDYLRLLFARIGTPYCPEHNIKIEKKTPESIANSIMQELPDAEVTILAPLVRQRKGTYEKMIEDLNRDGYRRARVDGEIIRTDEKIDLERYKKHDIEVVIDRLNTGDGSRLQEAVENALTKGEGLMIVVHDKDEKLFSSKMSCPLCDVTFEELQPRMFSFNSPFGACEDCNGLGFKQKIDPDLVIPDRSLSIVDGALKPYRNAYDNWRGKRLAMVGKKYGFDVFTPIGQMTEEQVNVIMFGSNSKIHFTYKSDNSSWEFDGYFEGIVPEMERLYRQTVSDYRKKEIERFMRFIPCPTCDGRRLKEKILNVRINEKNIIDVTDLSIKECRKFFDSLELTEKETDIARQVLKEIGSRLRFLEDVGLSYLTLSRTAGTLSGGEAQRIRLATQIGSNLMGVLYILDEPSIGLHQRDNQKLIDTLHHLRDLGNTLIVVEHDEDTIRNADYVIDMGPGAGIHGGEVVSFGTPQDIELDRNSLTGKYLSRELRIDTPSKRRESKGTLTIYGAREHNLKSVDVELPLGVLTVVTGVSGSGKSTLVYDILYKALMSRLHNSKNRPGLHDGIEIEGGLDKIIMIDQSPIGKTPRSNPATYIKVLDDIRNLFSQTMESKIKGYKPGRFSFNVKGGRCEACQGDGLIKIEMNFLPDVYVTCEECKGKRFNRETLEVTYKDKNIAEVLDMSVEEALEFFSNIPSIKRKLKTLNEVGLGYIKLGQSSTTLSGGEAQRIKLTKELAKKSTGNTLYLLDEPTTGLHFHDVKKLLDVLNRLVDKGNTVVIIEHNLDVIKTADHIIDLGPEGGDEGGMIVATGPPETISQNENSYTGLFLKKVL
ncbi:MAG TPA: excinuclease ABC subunit UvrA [Candidatus Methanofastidiosa archaeon]|nr:excinuclease ABC subunit UvrA [Candidatus Methanofastidiosa archaeon]